MKKIFVLILLTGYFGLSNAFAQTNDAKTEVQTLSANGLESGGYGALTINMTSFREKALPMLGVRGGWVINHTVAIGLDGSFMLPMAAYGLKTEDGVELGIGRMVGGYGGLLIEPAIFSHKLVHVNFPLTTGLGWMGYLKDWDGQQDYEPEMIDSNSFWYIQPGIGAELNVASFFRINLVFSYRWVYDLHLLVTEADAFNSWSVSLLLKFGKF